MTVTLLFVSRLIVLNGSHNFLQTAHTHTHITIRVAVDTIPAQNCASKDHDATMNGRSRDHGGGGEQRGEIRVAGV